METGQYYGKQCDVDPRYSRGYHRGTVIGEENGKLLVEFSSGMVESYYPDEVEFD